MVKNFPRRIKRKSAFIKYWWDIKVWHMIKKAGDRASREIASLEFEREEGPQDDFSSILYRWGEYRRRQPDQLLDNDPAVNAAVRTIAKRRLRRALDAFYPDKKGWH